MRLLLGVCGNLKFCLDSVFKFKVQSSNPTVIDSRQIQWVHVLLLFLEEKADYTTWTATNCTTNKAWTRRQEFVFHQSLCETLMLIGRLSFHCVILCRGRYCYGNVVCPSVTLRYRDHIGWKSSKIISQLRWCSLSADPTSRIYCKGNTPKFWSE